jgi:hypothetical protein
VYIPRKLVLVLAAVAALVFALGASGSSRDNGNGEALVRSGLAPSVPTDPAFHGIPAAGAPWVLSDSSVRLKASGELDISIEGLILPALGTAGPVTTVSASLLCGGDAQGGSAATTGTFPLSSAGDARIEATLSVPATCLAPSFVIHPNGRTTAYIAVSGWKA